MNSAQYLTKTKQCTKCKKTFPVSSFYIRKGKWFYGACKQCVCAHTRNYLRLNPHVTREAKKRYRLKNKQKITQLVYEWRKRTENRYNKKYDAKNDINRKAHQKVKREIKEGRLIKKPCIICGKSKPIEAHHCDYKKPLDIMWLCATHHRAWHKLFEPENRMPI